MNRIRQMGCALLALLMLWTFVPDRAAADDPLLFTSANDTLLNLDDATMPFWYSGRLYVPLTDDFCTELNLFYNFRRDTMKVLVYTRGRALTASLSTDTAEGNGGETYSCHIMQRGDIIFIPLDVLCSFFNLQYSYTRITYGYLVRVKNSSVVLSDATFIDAAGNLMSLRYNQYQRAKAPAEPATDVPSNNSRPSEPEARTVYLAVSVTSVEQAEELLAGLSARQGRVTFILSAPLLSEDDFLRRLVTSGHAVALEVAAEAESGAADVLAAIEEGNRLLWDAARYKTRLVRLSGAAPDAVNAVAEAGYCPVSFTADLSGRSLTASRGGRLVVNAVDRTGGTGSVYLGADSGVAGITDALLQTLRAENCSLKPLNELTAALT